MKAFYIHVKGDDWNEKMFPLVLLGGFFYGAQAVHLPNKLHNILVVNVFSITQKNLGKRFRIH